MSVVQNNVSLAFNMAPETAAHAALTPASSTAEAHDTMVEGGCALVSPGKNHLDWLKIRRKQMTVYNIANGYFN